MLAIAVMVALLDWLTKLAIIGTIPEGTRVEIIPGLVAFWHVKNPEMVLGLWGDLPLLSRQIIAFSAAVILPLLAFEVMARGQRLPPRQRPWVWAFVGLASGGMLGNLGERAVHWSVTDYLSLAWGDVWLPPGNIADIAILTSIPLALPVFAFELMARRRRGSFSDDARPPSSERDAPS